MAELVAHVGRHAGLDAAGADGDEGQAGQQPAPRGERGRQQRLRQVHQRQAEMPEAVDDRQKQDREVLAEEGVGHDAADDWKEIGAGHEEVHPLPRLGLGHEVGAARRGMEELCHEHDEDRLHSVERKPFRRLVADDVGNPRRHTAGGGRVGG